MRERIRRVSRIALILLANVALLVAFLVIIEGLSSYAFFLRDLVPRLRESNLSHTEYDAEIGWVGLPNVDIKDMYGPGAHLRTNRRGFRNAEDFPAKRDSDTHRIVCSGDSVTFGEHVGNAQTFCHLLSELDPKLETINMGQVGYGVDQAYLWYKRDADGLDVDVHIFSFITHDFMRMQHDKFMGISRPVVILEDGKPVVTNVPISQSKYAMPTWLAETLNSADGLRTMKLATKIRKRLNLAPRKVPGAWDARGADEVKAVIAGMFEDLRDYDSTRSRATVLVYFPSVEELQQPNAELAYWMSVVEANALRLGIPFINFVSLFGELPAADVARLFVDGYHFSEEGNALVARELFRYLRDDPRTSGRFTAPRQSSDGQPKPDPGVCTPQTCESLGHACGTPQDGCGGVLSCGVCGDGETCSSGTCIDAPLRPPPSPAPPPTGTPYEHVRPSDLGATIGVGVVAPIPTETYTGPMTVTTDGTVVENVVINGCPVIQADNVTLRNVIVTCSNGFWGVNFDLGDDGVLEYSKVNMPTEGKVIRISSPGNVGNNHQIRNNEIIGGEDFMWMNQTIGLVVENNYVHDSYGTPDSHSDGFQFSNEWQNDSFILIRGNYFDYRGTASPNEIFWNHSQNDITFENNFIMPFGGTTLRCDPTGRGRCDIRNNVYSNIFKNVLGGTYEGANIYRAVAFWSNSVPNGSTYSCNRYEDGSFIEQEWVSNEPEETTTHNITGCPSYP